jgi:hypothetical protein
MKIFCLFLCLITCACQPQNNSNPSAKELIKSREIKKVSSALILKRGNDVGDKIILEIRNLLSQKTHLLDSNLCNASHLSLLDTLENANHVSIRKINQASTNKTNLESQLLEAYLYNFENALPMSPSVQMADRKEVLYLIPVVPSEAIVRNCRSDTSSFLGLWSITFPVKTLVDQIEI